MSVLDQFRTAEERVAERLGRLKPFVEEYRELEQVARRLGLSGNQDPTAAGKERPAGSGNAPGRRDSKTKARSEASAGEHSDGAAAAKKPAATTHARGVRVAAVGRRRPARLEPEFATTRGRPAAGQRAPRHHRPTDRPGARGRPHRHIPARAQARTRRRDLQAGGRASARRPVR